MTGPWRNTVQVGPGAAQWLLDDLELGPRVAVPWASGRVGCLGGSATADRLRRLDPCPRPHYPRRPHDQLSLTAQDATAGGAQR